MFRIRSLLTCVVLVLSPMVAFSQAQAADTGWLESVRKGGYVIVVRHGLTTSDKSDPMANPSKGGDPMSNAAKKSSGDRQLSEEGRAQGKAIGEAMHKLKIPVGKVMTSPLQRAVDTGTLLAYGDVSVNPDLAEAGPALSVEENNRRAEAFRKLASTNPPAGANVVLVSHKPNILEAFGKDWSNVTEGEASVFQPDGKGSYKLIVRVKSDEWNALVQAAQ
jgi:broad specificity phosphatase PhoE